MRKGRLMDFQERHVRKMIRQGEGTSLEFKTCRDKVGRDVYESICAFLNRHGGTMLLGISDNGKITGIDTDAAAQIKKDIVTVLNNSQKINPPAYLSVHEIRMGKREE